MESAHIPATGSPGLRRACAVAALLASPSFAYEVHVEHNRCPADSRLWVHWQDRDGRWQTRWLGIDRHRDGVRLTYDGGKPIDTPHDLVYIDFDLPEGYAVRILNNVPRAWGNHRTVRGRDFMAFSDSSWFRFNLEFLCVRRPTEAERRTCELARELHARLVHAKCGRSTGNAYPAGTPADPLGDAVADGLRRRATESCVRNEMRKGPRHPSMGSLLLGKCDELVQSLRLELAARGAL